MARFRITTRDTDIGATADIVLDAADKTAAEAEIRRRAEVNFEAIEIVSIKRIAQAASAVAPEDLPPAGVRRTGGVIGNAVTRLTIAARSARPHWPKRGGKHEGIDPGKWREAAEKDETGQLPHDCPVRPLGYEGENFYFVDTMGQVFNTAGKALGVERMQILFAGQEDFLSWAWPAYSAKGEVTGFKTEEARRDLYAAIARRGPWSPTDMVRGRGAWTDSEGRLVLHTGEVLWVDGKAQAPGEYDGQFYPRRPATAEPWSVPVELAEDNPAVELFKALRTWQWLRADIDVMLLLGWIGVGLMSGALDWRPSVFIVGDAGSGKSQAHKLLKEIFGRLMIATTNATEAGLYQLVGHDSLPIAIDELEGEDGQAQAQKIIKMARDAASGSIRIRGGADHKGVEFAARSAFLFSAINPPPLPPASLTRLAVLQLKPLADRAAEPPVIRAAETIAPKLLRRIVDHWDSFPELFANYRTVLREKGQHDSRGQDTFGSFLAAAHLLLGDEGMAAVDMPFESLDIYGHALSAAATPELEGKQANWLRCIEAIMTRQIDHYRSGDKLTVAQWVERVEKDAATSFSEGERALAAADLGLLKEGIAGAGFGLAIPNSSELLGRLLQNTSYGSATGNGNWGFALSQAPDTIVKKRVTLKAGGKPDNRCSVAGFQRRCTFVGLKELREWMERDGAKI